MPVLATYFSVRRGRDPFFKFYMKTIFPRQVKEYGEKYGIKLLGWYNVAQGWEYDNVILLDLPDYATFDKLERDENIRALAHRGRARPAMWSDRRYSRHRRAKPSSGHWDSESLADRADCTAEWNLSNSDRAGCIAARTFGGWRAGHSARGRSL